MTRRPSQALARRLALALSVLLIGSTLALPALADDDTPADGIIAPDEGQAVLIGESLNLEAFQKGATSVQWAVRRGSSDPNNPGTLAGNVDGKLNPSNLVDGRFTATVPTADWQPDDNYFFVFNPSPGGRYVVQFELVDPFEGFDDNQVVTCEAGATDCTITQEGTASFTASTDVRGKDHGSSAFLGLRVADTGAEGDAIATAVSAACDAAVTEVNPAARLGPDVVQLVPVNFADGSITVRSTIPRSFVNSTVARGAGIFQVCVAAEDEDYGGFSGLPPIAGTLLFGPVILGDCTDDSGPGDACVRNKTKTGGAVVLTYQLPTEDPWLK